jgi:hypothetical protein
MGRTNAAAEIHSPLYSPGTQTPVVMWHCGRFGAVSKPLYAQAYRGFESLPLRSIEIDLRVGKPIRRRLPRRWPGLYVPSGAAEGVRRGNDDQSPETLGWLKLTRVDRSKTDAFHAEDRRRLLRPGSSPHRGNGAPMTSGGVLRPTTAEGRARARPSALEARECVCARVNRVDEGGGGPGARAHGAVSTARPRCRRSGSSSGRLNSSWGSKQPGRTPSVRAGSSKASARTSVAAAVTR